MYDFSEASFQAREIAEFLNETFEDNSVKQVRASYSSNSASADFLLVSTSIELDGNQDIALFRMERAKALLKKLFLDTTTIKIIIEPQQNLIFFMMVCELKGDLEDLLEDLKFYISFYLYKDRHNEQDLIIDIKPSNKATPVNLEDEVLRTDDVLKLLKIGRTSLYEFLKKPDFPKPGKMPTIKGNFWLKSQIIGWAEKNLALPSIADSI
jgi:predicted DNA-binding transcriptional regulator AlpA